MLVWSFYEKPDADAFLRECNQLFLGEEEGPAGGRLERLERGLRDGRPHLVVLDGLERVQEDVGTGRVRGELSDQTLKLLLRALASGLGRARALVTSRFPLVDLQDWDKRGYRDTRLDDLSPEAAVDVLRGWGVVGADEALRVAAAQVGNHALSVAVIGSYLHSFANGRIDEVASFDLDAVTGEDPKAAKLARVLASYAERLPVEERELLARLSVFPRGVSLDLLGVLIDTGGEVAGLLVNAKPRLVRLLGSLKARGLVFEYRSDASVTWTAHPFLRERFRDLLGIPAEKVFEVVAQSLGTGLEKRPETKPSDPSVLDRYERLIEATRLAGREQEAFDLVLVWMGATATSAGSLVSTSEATGSWQRSAPRGNRSISDRRTNCDTGPGLQTISHSLRKLSRSLGGGVGDPAGESTDGGRRSASQNTSTGSSRTRATCVIRTGPSGRIPLACRRGADRSGSGGAKRQQGKNALAYRAIAAHALGDIPAARTDFDAATELEGRPLLSLRGSHHARHHLDLGDITTARALCDHGFKTSRANNWIEELALFQALSPASPWSTETTRRRISTRSAPGPREPAICSTSSRPTSSPRAISSPPAIRRLRSARPRPDCSTRSRAGTGCSASSCSLRWRGSGWLGRMRRRRSRRRARRSISRRIRTASTRGARRTPRRCGARPTSPTTSPRSPSARSPAPSRCASASNTPASPKRRSGSPLVG